MFLHLVSVWYFDCFFVLANVTPISKDSSSSSVANYRPISITLLLSMMFEQLASVRVGQFMVCRGVIPTIQFTYKKSFVFTYRKSLGTFASETVVYTVAGPARLMYILLRGLRD